MTPDERSDRFGTIAGDVRASSGCGRAEVPAAIGNYNIVRELGRGGMGQVYLARHSRFMDRLYAIKTVYQRHGDSDVVARFEREIDTLAKLAHPNLLYAVDAGEYQGGLYLVTEYIDGLDLSKLVAQFGGLLIADACEITRQIAIGLGAAHEASIIHRDIKPSNIMLDRFGRIKVLDLGLALVRDNSADSLTGFQVAMGTPEYMSPEQWRGSHEVTVASDVYSLGCTLFFLLSTRPPFSTREFASLASLMHAHLEVLPQELTFFRSDVHPEIAALVHRCLGKDPQNRPSCNEIAETLEQFANQANLKKVVEQSIKRPSEQKEASRTSPVLQLFESTSRTESKVVEEEWTRFRNKNSLNWSAIILTTVVLLVSLTSLFMAYYGPNASETWLRRFDRLQDRSVPAGTGFAIEAVRAILFLSTTCAVCVLQFDEPLRRFFSRSVNNRSVWIARLTVVVLVSFFIRSEFTRHWEVSAAGEEMTAWAQSHQIETTPEQEVISYRWYLPYSLINYLYVFSGLVACPLLQFLLSDYRYLKVHLAKMARSQETARTSKDKLALLHQFGKGCRQLSTRYVDAAGVLAIGIQYEYWIGRWTLTDDGFSTEVLAWVVIAIMVWLFLLICHVYVRAIELTTQCLPVQDLEAEQQVNRIGLIWFVKSAVMNRLSGFAFMSLLLIAIATTLLRISLLK